MFYGRDSQCLSIPLNNLYESLDGRCNCDIFTSNCNYSQHSVTLTVKVSMINIHIYQLFECLSSVRSCAILPAFQLLRQYLG